MGTATESDATAAKTVVAEAVKRVYGKGPVTQRSMPFWCVMNRLSDPFGGPIFDAMTSLEATDIICEAATNGWIELTGAHDDDLVPWDQEHPEDDLNKRGKTYRMLFAIRAKLRAAGVGFHTMTCNLHSNPLFRQGGLTNPDPKIRELAKQKVRRAIRIGAFLGARKFTYWVARDGFMVVATTRFDQVYDWIAEGLNDARDYIKSQGFTCYQGGTIEPKPNEPTGHSHIPTTGHAVGFICMKLSDPGWWGVNPELLQHEGMTLLNATNCVGYLISCGKLSFLHFGNQIPGHEDNDNPPLVGPGGLKETVTMFWALGQCGWSGVVEYDCHMLRSEADPNDRRKCVLEFIENCSRGLALALMMAELMKKCSIAGMRESQADLAVTGAMCGLDWGSVSEMMQAQVQEAA